MRHVTPAQKRILDTLKHEPCTVRQLADTFSVSIFTIHKHLRALTDAGYAQRLHRLSSSGGPGVYGPTDVDAPEPKRQARAPSPRPTRAGTPFRDLAKKLNMTPAGAAKRVRQYEHFNGPLPRDAFGSRIYAEHDLMRLRNLSRWRRHAESRRVAVKQAAPYRETGLFTDAPPLRIDGQGMVGVTPRDEAEDLARRFLQQQPTRDGRKAATSVMLAEYTGMTQLDAIGALHRLVEADRKADNPRAPVRVYAPHGRLSTFYTGRAFTARAIFGTPRRTTPAAAEAPA